MTADGRRFKAMIDVPVYNMSGEQTGTMQIDEKLLGGQVRLRSAQAGGGDVADQPAAGLGPHEEPRRMVEGSTRKLFRQKGTGNARMGTVRTPVRRGGGMAFAKRERNYRREMPQKMQQLARNSALLAKLQGQVAWR